MAIPSGVILIWTSTNASIPSGWSRETALDDKYPKAWGTENPNVTGGSNTHTHSASGHTHTLIAHSHTVSTSSESGNATSSSGSTPTLIQNHTHSGTVSTTTGGGLQSTTVTWSSVNQEPPYYKVIFIKPTGTVAALPTGICAHYYGTTAPTLWNFCDGNNSTPDLRNKYLKGASAGADAGTTGGGTTHVHTISHTHTVTSHTHSGTCNASTDYQNAENSTYDNTKPAKTHTHSVSLAATTETINSYSNITAGGDTVEPAYKKLGVIKATVGSARKGMIGLWLGSVASIPANWVLCDGNNGTYDMRDKFVKIGANLGENNQTGGANTHTHSAISHTHTAAATHTHTVTGETRSADGGPGGSGVTTPSNTHTHTWAVSGAGTATYSTDNITADTVSNQPAYRTVAYIQLNKIDLGGAMLMSRLM